MKSANFADFVIVQSAWGMTQGFVMPLSGFLITAIGEKVFLKGENYQLVGTYGQIFVAKSLLEIDLDLKIELVEIVVIKWLEV